MHLPDATRLKIETEKNRLRVSKSLHRNGENHFTVWNRKAALTLSSISNEKRRAEAKLEVGKTLARRAPLGVYKTAITRNALIWATPSSFLLRFGSRRCRSRVPFPICKLPESGQVGNLCATEKINGKEKKTRNVVRLSIWNAKNKFSNISNTVSRL